MYKISRYRFAYRLDEIDAQSSSRIPLKYRLGTRQWSLSKLIFVIAGFYLGEQLGAAEMAVRRTRTVLRLIDRRKDGRKLEWTSFPYRASRDAFPYQRPATARGLIAEMAMAKLLKHCFQCGCHASMRCETPIRPPIEHPVSRRAVCAAQSKL